MKRIATNSFFLPYQVKWIRDNSRLKIMEKSRQIGISLAAAYSVVRRHMSGMGYYDTWISSRDDLQPMLFLDDCKKFAKIMSQVCSILGNKVVKSESAHSCHEIKFNNGTSIHSISSSVDAQAGKRGTRILDEFALHSDQKKMYSTSLPGITWGGQFEIISTHRGSNSFFNSIVKEVCDNGNPKKFSHHKVTLQDALEQGFLDKLKLKLGKDDERSEMSESEYFDYVKNACPDEESFLQEYMCVPSDDRSAFITSDMISECEYSQYDKQESEISKLQCSKNYFFLGVDIGRTHDLTVFWLVELDGDVLLTRKVSCLANSPFVEQERELANFLKLRNLRRACIDQTGIGRQFVEHAALMFGKCRIEGVTFTNQTKEMLAYQTRTIFENKQIKIPNDNFVRADIMSIRKETTFAGNIRFAGDRGSNGHADRFWALSLAVHAANIGNGRSGEYFEQIEMKFSNMMPRFL